MLGAGHCNGQFGIFDTRRGHSPIDATPMERSHRCAQHGTACFLKAASLTQHRLSPIAYSKLVHVDTASEGSDLDSVTR